LEKQLGTTGVTVKAFDHNIRTNKSSTKLKNGGGSETQTPVGLSHGDYTRVSAPRRLQDLALPPKINDTLRRKLGATDATLLDPTIVNETIKEKSRRYAFVNVRRNIDYNNPVFRFPLACIDAKTLNYEMDMDTSGDLRTLQIHYKDRIGENYLIIPSINHKWFYFPDMTHNEAMLIQQWDSQGLLQKDISTFCAHSESFDPTYPRCTI